MKKNTKKHIKDRKKLAGWPFGESLSPVHGEASLWAAVITQAMMDALTKAKNSEAVHNRHEAIRWLNDNSKDFITVCLLAGYDPDYIRKKAKKAIANPMPWRAEPGKGKRYHERRRKRQQYKKDLTINVGMAVIQGQFSSQKELCHADI